MLNLIYKWPKHAVRVQNTLPVMYNSDVQQKTRGLDEKVVVHVYTLISDFGKTFRTASSLLCIRKQLFFQIAAYIIHIWGCQDKGRISFKIRCMIVP